ncbi:MAG: hypothetical protein WCO84_05330 [bacterium]
MKNLFNKLYIFFDKFEDYVRGFLSHYPIPYSLLGGVGIVLFWKGVWDFADRVSFFNGEYGPIITIAFSVMLLLSTGLFVSFFIGDTIILSGIKKEKKLVEKTEDEVEKAEAELKKEHTINLELMKKIDKVEETLEDIKKKI